MKVLMISTDSLALDAQSAVRKRLREYSELFDELCVIICSRRSDLVLRGIRNPLAPMITDGNLKIFVTDSIFRLIYIYDTCRLGRKVLDGQNHSEWAITTEDPFETGLAGLYLKWRYKIPLQIQIHTDLFSQYFKEGSSFNLFRQRIARFTLPNADGLRVVSKRIKDSLQAISYKLQASPVILPIFTDIKKAEVAPFALDLHQKYPQFQKIILMISRITKEKNVSLGLRAFKKLLEKMPSVGLVIVGDGPERKNLELRVKNYKLENSVIFEGWQDDVSAYYQTADVFLNTSLYEGFGRSIIEALQAGCPTVSTDVGIAPEVLTKENGAVADFDDNDLSEKVLFWLNRGKTDVPKKEMFPEYLVSDKSDYLGRYKDALLELAGGNVFNVNKEKVSLKIVKFLVIHAGMIFKYIVSGGTATAVNLLGLFILTEWFGLWYILSSSLATAVAIIVSFLMQKFWTFNNRHTHIPILKRQALLYFTVFTSNLAVNAGLMYLFVDYFGLGYLTAQFLSSLIVAGASFFAYKKIVFKASHQ